MAWSAVASAVKTIGQLLAEEAEYLWGVEKQVDRLQTELKWMQSSLMEADVKQHTDERIRLWVAEIRELAYDAEDVIEDFALKRKGGLSGCIKRSACILREGWELHQTRSKIEEIIERILDLVRRLQVYNVKGLRDGEGSTSLSVRRELRRPYPHIIDQNTVGLKDGIEKLVPKLLEEGTDTHCRVVSIWGMGGLGKTTLAKKLYQDSQVTTHFKHMALVFVSQQFQTRRVWEDILSGFKKLDADDRKQNDETLASKLCNLLKDEKCLVILDDIWSTEAWDRLKPAFPAATDHSNSKILLTSRNEDIVSHADRSGHPYKLPFLSDKESWDLFQKIAFPPSDSTGAKLPSSLGNLICLQTLDLRVSGTDRIHVPDVIWRMEQLRHLYLPKYCTNRTKLKLGTLRNLQTLVNFNTKHCYLKDLINMTNLRELEIHGPFKIEDFNAENLGNNPPIIEGKHLRSLSIISKERIDPTHLNHLLSSCPSICKLTFMSEGINKLSELHYLSLNLSYIHWSGCRLQEDPMPTLEQLPNLRALELHYVHFQRKEMCCSAQGFPKLESLSLWCLGNLERWKVDGGAMPCLRRLEIVACVSLERLPDGLRFIKTLQELKIIAMPEAFKDKVVQGGQDFYKVKHVPSLILLTTEKFVGIIT